MARLLWPLPVALSRHRDARAPATAYLSHLLGHEGDGSLFACLQAEGLATGVSSGLEATRDFGLLSVTLALTPDGEAQLERALARVYEYVHVLARAGAGDAARAAWAEHAQAEALLFRYAERGDATGEATAWARRLNEARKVP